MDETEKSGFLTALEWFWNSWGCAKVDLLLVISSSAISWMTRKVLKRDNRITRILPITPFTLLECEEFYQSNGILMSRYQIVQGYMIFGGIPYYLNCCQKHLSLSQNIDDMFFSSEAVLKSEYASLLAYIHEQPCHHQKVLECLSQASAGRTRLQIVKETGVPDGGTLTNVLENLKTNQFIDCYPGFSQETKGRLYRLIDPFTLFFLHFLTGGKNPDEHFWSNFSQSETVKKWQEHAFSQVCIAHLKQIQEALGFGGVRIGVHSWKSKEPILGAEIDLVLDRADLTINLCEIKFSKNEYSIDKPYEAVLRNKIGTFLTETKTRKTVNLTMISPFRLKFNAQAGIVQSEVLMDDLFR